MFKKINQNKLRLFLELISIFFIISGCSISGPWYSNEKFVVDSIEKDGESKKCFYQLTNKSINEKRFYTLQLKILQECGKFQIGDKIVFIKNSDVPITEEDKEKSKEE